MTDNAHSLQSSSVQALLRRGYRALSFGDIAAASACCREALRRRPDLVQGHFLVALVALEAKDRKTAFSAFRSVTKLDEHHAAAWAHLARLLITEGQVNRADLALDAAVKHVASEPIVEDLIGTVYSLMGEYGLAGNWFSRAVGHQPDHPPFMLNLANNHVYQGRIDAAGELFDAIIAIQPGSPQAHWALAGSRRAGDGRHIAQMRTLLAAEGTHPRAQAFYLYAIGKEHEDLGQWEQAFAAFRAGARARRTTVEFDEANEIATFEFLECHFTAEWLERAGAGHPSAAPVFVLGQPRTGTTLVDRIIGSHSAVHSAGELQQFSLNVRRLSNHTDPRRFSPALFEAALGLDVGQLGALYLDTTRRMQGGTPHFVDKLPQNYLMIPLILAALPNARIVHLTRDPMDACFASFKQLFADAYLHSYDQAETARHHARYLRLMATWRERFPGRFLDVAYEDTVQDLAGTVRRVLAYLGLPWEDAVLRFHEQDSAVSTASAVQVREPVHTRSIGRWRKYALELEPMRAALRSCGVLAAHR